MSDSRWRTEGSQEGQPLALQDILDAYAELDALPWTPYRIDCSPAVYKQLRRTIDTIDPFATEVVPIAPDFGGIIVTHDVRLLDWMMVARDSQGELEAYLIRGSEWVVGKVGAETAYQRMRTLTNGCVY